MMQQILDILGISDLSGVPPDVQFALSALMALWVVSECFRLLRIVLYRIFGGDR